MARSGGGGEERRRWRGSPAAARIADEERQWWRGAAARSGGEELGVHDRGGVKSGGAAAQGKGQGQSLTSQVQPAAMQPAACIVVPPTEPASATLPLARRFSGFHPQRQPAARIAAVATWPAAQAESETVRQGACGKTAAGVFSEGQESTRDEE